MSDSAHDPASAAPAVQPPAPDDPAAAPPPPPLDTLDDARDTSPSSSTHSSPHHAAPLTYSGMPMHMYPFASGLVQPQPSRTKRRQVKNACTNCQKACKKCDDARPCLRCVKYGIAEECIDSQRKERQKGIKRGPYKKRDGKDRASSTVDGQHLDLGVQSGLIPAAIAAANATPPMSYMAPMPYPGFFSLPPAAPPKPGEAPTAYTYPATQYYFAAPIPMPPPQPGQEGDAPAYPTGFYPITFAPYGAAPYPAQYMVPAPAAMAGRDGQPPQGPPMPMQMPMQMQMGMGMQMAQMQGMAQMPMPQMQMQYAAYPPAYPKPPSASGRDGGELGTPPQMMEPAGRREVRLDQYNGRMGEGHGKTA